MVSRYTAEAIKQTTQPVRLFTLRKFILVFDYKGPKIGNGIDFGILVWEIGKLLKILKTTNRLLFVVCGLLLVVCRLWFVVCGLWFVVCRLSAEDWSWRLSECRKESILKLISSIVMGKISF